MKKITFTILSCLTSCLLLAQITQLGADIDGEASNNEFGNGLSMNADGTIIAAGAPFNDDNGLDTGSVRVLQLNSGDWVQLGQDIDGVGVMDLSGLVTNLNASGDRIAISSSNNDTMGADAGLVKVYEFDGTSWTQLGQDLFGENSMDQFGIGLSLNAEGTILAVGATGADINGQNTGSVSFFNLDNDSWIPLGNAVAGIQDFSLFGQSVELSSDGTRAAIGAGFSSSGRIWVYEYDGTTWETVGNTIQGASGQSLFGGARISNNGQIIAGTSLATINGQPTIIARVFGLSNSVWLQIGDDIISPAFTEFKNISSMDLNGDGKVLALGAPGSFLTGSGFPGTVTLYQSNGSTWTQLGDAIEGEGIDDNFGTTVKLNDSGAILAIGGPRNAENGPSTGHVRVFDLSTLGIESIVVAPEITLYPNPASDVLNLQSRSQNLKEITLFSIDGKIVKTIKPDLLSNKIALPIADLSAGQYMIAITSDKQTSVKKFLKQ